MAATTLQQPGDMRRYGILRSGIDMTRCFAGMACSALIALAWFASLPVAAAHAVAGTFAAAASACPADLVFRSGFEAPEPPCLQPSPYPIYTEAEVAAWNTSLPQYQRLATSWAGIRIQQTDIPSVTPQNYGTQVSTALRDVLRDQAVYIKVQAVLWKADGNNARRQKIVTLLDTMRGITSWEWDSGEQYRLVAGWASTNLAQAAAIIDYRDPQFIRFLTQVNYPMMDWPGAGNWQGSFADSKLAIAVYARDEALYQDAKAYFHLHLPQTAYHSAYDGNKVRPVLGDNGQPNLALTKAAWGGYWGPQWLQINDDYTFVNPSYVQDGFNSETIRDFGHVSMGLAAWMHGARTILAHGDTLEPEAYERIRAGYALHAKRVLALKQTGVSPAPVPRTPTDNANYGWFGAQRLFGADTPAEVNALCVHPDVTGYPAPGGNHTVAEAFADGQ